MGVLVLLFGFVPIALGLVVQQGVAMLLVNRLGISATLMAILVGASLGFVWVVISLLYYTLLRRVKARAGM
jgi:hypothetical protein